MKTYLKAVPLILILFFIFVVYKQVISFDYLWDDDLLLVNNVALLNSNLNWEILARPVLDTTSYFRPFVFLSWFIEFKVFGQSAAISHLINLILFLMNISLVYALSYFLAKAKQSNHSVLLASICALVYAIHPIHVETTAWVSGRFDLMATLFILFGCVVFTYSLLKQKTSILLNLSIALCCFFALLSKELGIVMPILLLLLYCAVAEKNIYETVLSFFKNYKSLVLSLGCFIGLYFVLRIYSMQQTYHYPITWEYYRDYVIGQQLPLYAIKQYVLHALFPFDQLGPFQPIKAFITPTFTNVISIVITAVALVCIAFYGLMKKNFFSLMLLCYLATISLVIFLVPLSSAGNIIQERFMTLGLSFFVIGTVFLLSNLQRKVYQLSLVLILIVWLGGATLTTKSVLPFWKTELGLWGWVYQQHPEIAMVRNLFFGSLIKYQFNDQFIEIINRDFISKDKGLHIADQILYGRALLTKEQPESLGYLKGATFVLPAFHNEKFVSKAHLSELTGIYELTPMLVATAFDSLSIATLWFENKPELALKYNQIAEYYLDQAEVYPLLYNRVAILDVLGDKKASSALQEKLIQVQMYNKEANIKNIEKIKQTWCELNRSTRHCSF